MKVSELSGSGEPKEAILGVEFEFASLERLEVTADGQWQGYSAKDNAACDLKSATVLLAGLVEVGNESSRSIGSTEEA